MKMQNMYEAGVGLAHEANRAHDLIQEHIATKESLNASENAKAEQRATTIALLGLKARPEDFNDCDSPDFYMSAALLQIEQSRFDGLMEKAALLIDAAMSIEQESSLAKTA